MRLAAAQSFFLLAIALMAAATGRWFGAAVRQAGAADLSVFAAGLVAGVLLLLVLSHGFKSGGR